MGVKAHSFFLLFFFAEKLLGGIIGIGIGIRKKGWKYIIIYYIPPTAFACFLSFYKEFNVAFYDFSLFL